MAKQTTLGIGEKKHGVKAAVECLGMTFESDEARRAHFTEILRQKLADPAVRATPGFPKATDEAILRMSDPPYYTACPNPFVGEFVSRFGHADDGADSYHRDPLAMDVTENKHHPVYLAHTYHTKVPHRAIMRYILHYTSPGDVVLDAFCGTGMTGVAAVLCGDVQEVEALGYRVSPSGDVLDAAGKRISKLGIRRAVMSDLSPMASWIAFNHVRGDSPDLPDAFEAALGGLTADFEWMFQTLHDPSDKQLTEAVNAVRSEPRRIAARGLPVGTINYSIWSEVFLCPQCAGEIVFWDAAVDRDNGKVRESFPCPTCTAAVTKREMAPAMVNQYDQGLRAPHRQVKTVPVAITYTWAGRRYEKVPDAFDRAMVEVIHGLPAADWYPTDRLPDGIETRRNDEAGLTHFHHFYTDRNLRVLSAAWARLPEELRWVVTGCLHRGSRQHQVAITRVGGEKAGDGGATAGHRRGTLYVPSNQVEMNAITLLADRAKSILRAMSTVRGKTETLVSTQSASSLALPPESIDYFFFDPPFGANIAYSELNSTSEAWHRVFTHNEAEAIEDRAQRKGTDEYRRLIGDCFKNVYRALKPGRWMTVEFSNTKAAVWNALQTALQDAGFVVASVSGLSKGRGGLMAIVGVTAMKQDLVISAYKPSEQLARRFVLSPGTADDAWAFVREHLRHVPVYVEVEGDLDVISERTAQLLHDRMVAFFVQRGATVPLNGPEFFAGLEQRFARRDGMYLLPDQVAAYDKKRASSGIVRQLQLFVMDEASAIRWLRQTLDHKPQSFQDLQPEFIKAASNWARHERTVDLRELLRENFLRYDGAGEVPAPIHSYLSTNLKLRKLDKSDPELREAGRDRWYVPSVHRQGDLEQLRLRALLKEFEEYKVSSQRRIRQFRTEAVRAGFKAAYDARDYRTIVEVAAKLPDEVVQEDEKLLMYVDVATMRYDADQPPTLFPQR